MRRTGGIYGSAACGGDGDGCSPDREKALGGSCVNTGCIPAKALLQATAVYRDMLKAFRFGIVAEKVSFDWRQMQIYKNESVESFRSMVQGMLEKAEVEMIHGDARLHADNVVRVTTSKGALTLKGKNVILATGSSPVIPDIRELICRRL